MANIIQILFPLVFILMIKGLIMKFGIKSRGKALEKLQTNVTFLNTHQIIQNLGLLI